VRLYHQGDRGEPVLDIQERLSSLGYDVSSEVAGLFGNATMTAVSQFQVERGLPVDGIVGPETWRGIVDAGYNLGDRMLYHRVPTMRGDDIAELQARLNSLGFDTGKVDGIFGPDTLTGLIDFQHNRGLAEDGISGQIVAAELRLVDRTAQKPGREAVRERQWLSLLPPSIAGQRIYIDPECRDEAEAAATWAGALAARSSIQLLGGLPSLSRSIDTAPPSGLRAQRANRVDADIVVGLSMPRDGAEGIYYFSSEHSRSEAGLAIATVMADRFDVPLAGRTMPILKETRAPAVLVSVRSMNRRVGRVVANVVAALYGSADGGDPGDRATDQQHTSD
jgi:N-acetylmuramoyl-L-alanine amidase